MSSSSSMILHLPFSPQSRQHLCSQWVPGNEELNNDMYVPCPADRPSGTHSSDMPLGHLQVGNDFCWSVVRLIQLVSLNVGVESPVIVRSQLVHDYMKKEANSIGEANTQLEKNSANLKDFSRATQGH